MATVKGNILCREKFKQDINMLIDTDTTSSLASANLHKYIKIHYPPYLQSGAVKLVVL